MQNKKPYEVKAVLFLDDAPNMSHQKLYEIFFEALKNKKLNHFEITGGGSLPPDPWKKN
jgi:hypothetical protein